MYSPLYCIWRYFIFIIFLVLVRVCVDLAMSFRTSVRLVEAEYCLRGASKGYQIRSPYFSYYIESGNNQFIGKNRIKYSYKFDILCHYS